MTALDQMQDWEDKCYEEDPEECCTCEYYPCKDDPQRADYCPIINIRPGG